MHAMKKRLLAGLMIVMMLLSNVMPVFAATEEDSPTKTPKIEAVTVQEPAASTAPEALSDRTVRFYAYVNDKLTLIETRTNVTTYWIGNRQCIDTATLDAVYGKLGFEAANLTIGAKLFLHTDWNDGTIWAEGAKEHEGLVYAAAINHKENGSGGAPGNKFDLFYLPNHTVGGSVGRENAATIANETFYTVTNELGDKAYHLKGTEVAISCDASAKDWTCVGSNGDEVQGVLENETITFTIPAISQAYTLTATDKPVPQPVVLTAKVNGQTFDGSSLSDIVRKSGVAVKDVQTLEFVSGELTKADRDYIASELKWMTTMTLNVSETMLLLDNDGTPTTVLGKETASFAFGTPDGWSSGALETLTLGGITEVQADAIESDNVKTINLPDVVTVGNSALGFFHWLKTLYLPKAETVGDYAFSFNVNLENLTLNAVETLGKGSFEYTDSLRKLTLPETITDISNISFGRVDSGNKSGTVITIKATTPPTVAPGAFNGIGSFNNEAVAVVPQGALANYVHQEYPDVDVTKLLTKDQVQWNNLYLREAGSYTIRYYNSAASWETKYAYVTKGDAVTAAQIPAYKVEEGKLFLGWNTKQNGTGDMITAGFVPTADLNRSQYGELTVYPIVVDAVTITVDLGDTTQTVKVEKNKAIGDKLPAAPVKDENHDFAGWFDADGNAVTEKTVAENNMTIHPTWSEDFNHNDIDDTTEPRYTVIYTDAGQHPSNPVFEAKVFENILVGMPTPSFGEDPVREGEIFAGWAPQVFDTVNSDMLYSAIWYKDENKNGIPDKDEGRFSVTYTDGADGAVFANRVFSDLLPGVKTPVISDELVREGYVFAGWTPEVAETVTNNAVYTAIWKEDNNNNGIADDVDTYHKVTIIDGRNGEVFAPVQLGILTGTKLGDLKLDSAFEGYAFKGLKDQDGNAVTSDTVVTRDLTLTVQLAKLFQVHFDVDGEKTTVEVEDGQALGEKLPAAPEKEGYTFKGWKNQDGKVVTADTVVSSDMTILAVFEKNAAPVKPVEPGAPATGETAPVMIWMLLATFAMFGAVLTFKKRREYR